MSEFLTPYKTTEVLYKFNVKAFVASVKIYATRVKTIKATVYTTLTALAMSLSLLL